VLTSLGGLDDYAVVGPADDGHLGRVRDTYFDERRWSIRHLAVETGHWPGHQRVLIRPGRCARSTRRGAWCGPT